MYLVSRTNQALDINPPAGDEHLTTAGSDWLWAVTAVFVLEFVSSAFFLSSLLLLPPFSL